MKKNFICLMLGVTMMIASCAPVMAKEKAKVYSQEGTDVTIFYNVGNSSVEKTNKAKNTNDTAPTNSVKLYSFEIPAEIDGQKVLAIADSGFFDDNALQSIILPEGLTEIGTKAFAGADNLTAITIPASVKKVGKEAFSSCDALRTVKLGKGMKTIPQYCFKGCKAITTITVPENVKTIENSAFEGCKELKTVNFAATVNEISNSAFKGCGLVEFTVPAGVETISSNVFEGCSSLEKVTMDNGVKKIDNAAFKDCKSLKVVYIPDSCKNIADSAFNGCKNVVIYCSRNSYAESFAEKQGLKIEYGKPAKDAEKAVNTSGITVKIDGEVLDCGKAQPVIVDGRTLVPLRPIFEALDVELNWNNTTKTIVGSKGTSNIKLVIGSTEASLNGQSLKLDVPAQIIDGYTMVPLRFISDCLGCEINWSQQTKTASISQ